jgi:hypothetical protein
MLTVVTLVSLMLLQAVNVIAAAKTIIVFFIIVVFRFYNP